MDSPSPLLRLPSELRVRIYELVLTFSRPIKLRQTVAGSENTTLLRVNRQICEEALAVLYDANTIAVTRNDFCTNTDAALKTPIPSQYVRHLLVTSFNESIACNFVAHCGGCKSSASGFLAALKAMPRLKSVHVDYATARSRFYDFKHSYEDDRLQHTSVGVHTLRDKDFRDVDFTFQCGAIGRMWSALNALPIWPSTDEVEEKRVLTELREIEPSMPDKLWLIIWTLNHSCITSDHYTWLKEPLPPPYDQTLKYVDRINMSMADMVTHDQQLADTDFVSKLRGTMDFLTAKSCRVVLDVLRKASLRLEDAA